jgi:hypothetical protein
VQGSVKPRRPNCYDQADKVWRSDYPSPCGPPARRLSKNHLEGRSAAFFCYGDRGGADLDATGRPKILMHKEWFDPKKEPCDNERDAYQSLVWQCRYSGVEVPDALRISGSENYTRTRKRIALKARRQR